MTDVVFPLEPAIADLVKARNHLRDAYADSGLTFTLDGNLVGDIGEAVAARIFGIKLVPRNGTGIDGHAPDGRSVQIKATGTGRGPSFRDVDPRAEHLLFLELDFEILTTTIIFNGPESLVLRDFPVNWLGQKAISMAKIVEIDARISPVIWLHTQITGCDVRRLRTSLCMNLNAGTHAEHSWRYWARATARLALKSSLL